MKKLLAVLFVCASVPYGGVAQNAGDEVSRRVGINTITTAVPFLLIAPDSRAGAMGDVGVATSPDANSTHWNPAKYAFIEDEMGISLSYTPWLRKLVPDINLSYLSGYKKIDDMQTISASLLYFSLGNIQFTDEFGNETRQFNPNEFAFDVAYSRKLSDFFSGGISLRYIHSNLTGGTTVNGADTKPGQAVAADISTYYQNEDITVFGRNATVAAGANISNIGNKMAYTNTAETDFIPINLRIGPRLTMELDDHNSISLAFDVNKLLVPSPPVYLRDSAGQPVVENGEYVIGAGEDPNRAVASGMFGSFTDAPGEPILDANGNYIRSNDGTYEVEQGSVFKEEMREINIAAGFEYWYDNQFAVRAGYFWEHELKGNRKFFTLGAGLRYKVFGMDFSYLIPAYFQANNTQRSPLENTLRFTLTFDFEAFKAQNESPDN